MSLSGSLEWGIVSALRGYLIVSLETSDEEFSQLNEDTISMRNAQDGFEFELTRVFERQEPSFNTYFACSNDLQVILEKFIVLLEKNVKGRFQMRSEHFADLFQPLYTRRKLPYYRLWSLLEHLESSGMMFNLIRGRHGPAFNLPSKQTLLHDLKIVQELNHILDTIPSPNYYSPVRVPPPSSALLDDQDVSVYGYAVETFRLNLCKVIELSQSENEGLRIHVISNEIQNLSQVAERCRHDGDSPSICLRQMISDGAFKKPTVEELLANGGQLRFNRDQKRLLAERIAVALSQLSGSRWVREGWTAKEVYFLGGSDSADQMEWVAKLVKTPHLILFGKLLLEIELGEDLDKLIDDGLRTTPRKNVSTLLLGMYEKAKGYLDNANAIQACLNFHKERRLRREAKEIDVPQADWCEWDRKYIRDNVVANLVRASQVNQSKKGPLSNQKHDPKYKSPPLAYPRAHNTSGVGPLLQPPTHRTSDSEDTKGPGFAFLSKSPARDHTIRVTDIDQDELQSNKEVKFPINPTHHSIQTTIRKNTEIGASLDNVKDVAPDEEVLFEDLEYSHPPEHASLALAYWEELRKFNNRLFPRTRRAPTTSSIKIALIDTGVDMSDPLIKGERARITGRSWVGDNPDNYHDTCGHGTHLVRLVLQTSQTAHIFMAKVSDDKNFGRQIVENIAEAISWAVKEENTHIISLSLGFRKEYPGIKAALEESINPEMIPRRIIFAAGGNWGYNFPPAFPAEQKGVLRIHGVTGNGGDGNFNVKVDPDNRIATLGVAIESQWQGKKVWISGTSFATPIAAATAANLLEFARQYMGLDLDAQRWGWLSSFRGMRAVLRRMCTDTDKFEYMTPWHLGKNADEIAENIRDSLDYGSPRI
ncbi:hypothetical protein GQX73_g10694 [Xylaria multiplex]|uniref:Uncharacterized protein n=1 Tax=Xylaria multiplex TaxID=323545 RepID=A0A7C8IJW9_9PEZI|nr:hypothetical protein GQX73_g10694 [Xylaria multiplex]